MSKAVLIIDMPKSCADCPLLYEENACYAMNTPNSWFLPLVINGSSGEYKVNQFPYKEKRVDWCPLKHIPTKKVPVFNPNDCDMEEETKIIHEIEGYNNCINEILEGENRMIEITIEDAEEIVAFTKMHERKEISDEMWEVVLKLQDLIEEERI